MSDCGCPRHLQGMSMDVSGLAVPTDRPDHITLFREHLSRKAAGKARAVLEGVGLDTPTIDACFSDHRNVEEIVQAGLVKWRDGQGDPHKQPPTWEVLISAMEYARIAQPHIKELKDKLAPPVKGAKGTLTHQCHDKRVQLSVGHSW